MRDDEPRPVRMSLLITHTRRCASAGKIPWLEGMNPQTDHHRVVSRNPCESLSLILRQWLLWANISAGVTPSSAASAAIPAAALRLPRFVDSPLPWVVVVGGVVACAFPTSPARCRVLRRAGTPGKSCDLVVPLKNSLPLGNPLGQMAPVGIALDRHDLSRL